MTLYRKRPLVVQAAKIMSVEENEATFDCGDDDAAWMEEACGKDIGEVGGIWVLNEGVRVGTLEGTMRAEPGDYIVRGTEGEIYSIKGRIFDKTYEPVGSGD